MGEAWAYVYFQRSWVFLMSDPNYELLKAYKLYGAAFGNY